MPLGALLDGFFTEEWNRFLGGVAKLDPLQQQAAMREQRNPGLAPGETATISIPGWDEIIRLGPRYVPTREERSEVRAAARQGRTPAASPEAVAAVRYGDQVRERIRTSAQPAYAQAFGEIMTAVDNVQDFASTISTFGRLGVWATELGLNALAPGATAAVAAEAGRAAARLAQQAAFGDFDRALLAAARAGEPVAAFLLGNEARRLAAQRAAVELAGRSAFQTAFRTALLGLGGRLALRLLPVVGWALLAADLLNLLNLLGLLAFPFYAAICVAPRELLAAGVPAVVFGRALKQKTWALSALNPFSREGRAKRAAKAARGIPGIGALLEVAQTTENLFGIGVTLGGLVGAAMESVFAGVRAQRGERTTINLPGGVGDLRRMMDARVSGMSTAELIKNGQAATVLTTAPAILGVQETFDDETHLLTMVAYAVALSTLAPLLRGLPWQDVIAELAETDLRPPGDPSDATLDWAAARGLDLQAARGWWFAGGRPTVTGAEYATHQVAAIQQATRDFITPRRNTPEGAFYGMLLNSITEALWLMLEDDADFFRWELTTDTRLLASLVESNRLINRADGETRVWALWKDAREVLEWSGKASLQAAQWDYLAKRNDVGLIKLLPPGSPWPEEWQTWLDSLAPDPSSPQDLSDLFRPSGPTS